MWTPCASTNGWVPPVLLPGMDDCAWCVTNCNPCDTIQRRYADCDYIDITPKVKKTFVRMLASYQNPIQVDPTRTRIYIEIRRRGCPEQVACYDAYQRTADGYVGFYWDGNFTGADPGLYVGDVFVECNYCFSLHFRIPRCELIVIPVTTNSLPKIAGRANAACWKLSGPVWWWNRCAVAVPASGVAPAPILRLEPSGTVSASSSCS
jgi:hypothetical protein